jgi:carboxypeptidase Q
MKKQILLILALAISYANYAQDNKVVNVIKKHGIENSKVMDIASWMTDVYGQRLTASTGLAKAEEWAKSELTKMGLKNAHLEEWKEFGRGWDMTHFEMHTEAPNYWPIIAYPKAWSAPTKGTGEVIYLNVKSIDDLAKYKGKLSGKFVLMDSIRPVEEAFEATAKRHD